MTQIRYHHPSSFRVLLLVAVFAFLAWQTALSGAQDSEAAPSKPRALQAGDRVAIVAPSAPLNEERVARIVERLAARGVEAIEYPSIYKRYGYLGGTDEERAKDFMDAWLDPEIDAVFPGTGGFGATRILDRLDYGAIAANPKIMVGFSDTTALHLAIHKKANMITFHTPSPMYSFGSEEMDPFTERHLYRILFAEEYADDDGPGITYALDGLTTPPVTIVPGLGRGRLVGGNLSLVSDLMGTPFEIETEGRIIFLEDVNEAPYRVDRMLSGMYLAGKFDKPAAVILGLWRGAEPDNPEKSLSLDQIFDHYFAGRPYPVVKYFPVGHVSTNAALPVGALAELDTRGEISLRLLEDPVILPTETPTKSGE